MSEKKRVAIIGAGSSGTLTAYRLRERLGDDVHITVYERNEHAGGRAWDIEFAGATIEVGGSILHSSGEHTMALMEYTGSAEGESGLSVDGKDETYAFFTDKGFCILTHTTLMSMALGIVKHVGIPSALKVTNLAKDMAARWGGIYALQKSGAVFKTADEMLDALGLKDASKTSLDSYFEQRGVNRRMREDVVEAITHNMYNQGLEMNAFAGLVGLAGAGLAGGYLFCIDGGNWTLFQKAVEKSADEVHYGTAATSVIAETGTTAEVGPNADGDIPTRRFRVSAADGISQVFDAVVIAAPLALADLTIEDGSAPIDVSKNPYQRVNTTLVAGDLDPAFFKTAQESKLPSTVFTATSSGAPFKSIGVTGYSPLYKSRIYKIFSGDHEMQEGELSRIFAKRYDQKVFVWPGAYPVLTPGVQHVPFEIAPGLYYACAFETAAGAIEVEAVAGVNTANLLTEYLEA